MTATPSPLLIQGYLREILSLSHKRAGSGRFAAEGKGFIRKLKRDQELEKRLQEHNIGI